MERIFFAIGHEAVENRIKTLLNAEGFEYEVCYTAVHKESIINELPSKRPTILIMREGLPGKADIFQLAVSVKSEFPEIRIIFLAAARGVGDPNIANLVAYHIYDILAGETLSVPDLIKLIIHPNMFEDVSKFLPKKNSLFDKDSFGELGGELNESKGPIETTTEHIINIAAPVQIKDDDDDDDDDEIQIDTIPIDGKDKPGFKLPKLPFKEKKKPGELEPTLGGEDEGEMPISEPSAWNDAPSVPIKQKNKQKKEQKSEPEYENGDYYEEPPHRGRKSEFGFHKGYVDDGRLVTARQRLMTFYSPKGGIGTTTVALNAAAEAAARGRQRVLLIEYNTEFSAIAYWFELPNSGYGLEDAIMGIGTDYNAVNDAIITKEKALNAPTSYTDGIKRFPETLDFLLFSDSFYKKNVKPNISPANLEKLITYCLFTLNYDEVFLDMSSTANRDLVNSSLISSGKNIILMSQDVSIINNVVMFFSELNRKGIKFDIGLDENEEKSRNISYKNIYVVNKATACTFSQSKIKKWTGCKNICSIPENGEEIINYLDAGYIPLTVSKNRQFKESFKLLGNLIEE